MLKPTPFRDDLGCSGNQGRGEGIAEIAVIADIARDRKSKSSPQRRGEKQRSEDRKLTQASTFTLTTPDGVDLFVYCWLPNRGPKNDQPKAVVQIAHGLAEHAGRYAHILIPPREARVGDHEPANTRSGIFLGAVFSQA